MGPAPTALVGLRYAMVHDHSELAQNFERLIEACRAGACDDAAAEFAGLEHRLANHLAFEEEVMFPRFERVDAEEVAELTREHARIRRLTEQLGVDVDLHALRLAHAEDLVTLLRAHAKREDELLYRWAEASLGPRAAAAEPHPGP